MNPWILRLITLVVGVASPELRNGVTELLNKLETQAQKTSNPWDDMLVALLKDIMLAK